MRTKEEIIKDITGMDYKNDTNKEIYKKGTPENHTGVDFRKGGIVPYWWNNNERIDDPEDARAKDCDDFMVLLQVCGGYDEEVRKPEQEVLPPEDNTPSEPEEEPRECTKNESKILQLIEQYTGNDVIEIFGDTGTGKSKLCLHVAQEATKAGKKVFYLDTERNLTQDDLDSIKGAIYKYTPDLKEIIATAQKLPKCDCVIIDSVGFPILTEFAMMSLKERGDALLSMIAIFGTLKKWCYHNNGFALVTNQPESEFNKSPDHILRPFGDKSQFAAKEIWKTEYEKRSPKETKSKIVAFRSRSAGHQTLVARMTITDKGVEVI